jgi:hypothetical protein
MRRGNSGRDEDVVAGAAKTDLLAVKWAKRRPATVRGVCGGHLP